MVNVVREPPNGEAVMTAQTLQATEAATPKIQYRVTNWPEYDRVLVERGSLTLWFDEEFLQSRWRPAPTGGIGGAVPPLG